MIQLTFDEQLEELRKPCVKTYFKDKNIFKFLKTYVNIDMLLNNYHTMGNVNKGDNISIFDKLVEINELTENILVKELVCSIKKQLCEKDTLQLKKELVDKEIINVKPCDVTLLNNLIQLFPMADICNIDHMSKFQNVIQIKEDEHPFILIYSETNSDVNISKTDVETFYRDIKESNACGILCNSKSGISNKDNFEIDIQDSNVYVFISNHQYESIHFKLAVKIIYSIYDIIRDNNGMIEIDKELLTRLKLEYNYYMISHKKYINSMRSNLLSLEQLSLTQLDHFFKRTHINSEDKAYSCQMCGTKFGTDKSLKSHLKSKHDIQLCKKRNKKEIKEVEEQVEEQVEENGYLTFD